MDLNVTYLITTPLLTTENGTGETFILLKKAKVMFNGRTLYVKTKIQRGGGILKFP